MITRSFGRNQLAGFGVSLLVSAIATAANAAVLEEVVVTAQKREQNLQEVPVAITAFSGDRIESSLITGSEDLVKLAPSLSFNDAAFPTNASFRLRGAGTQSASSSVEPSVAVLYDGVVMNRPAQGISDLADVERIEVLRGPQGTLFGKNASAGAIHIITKRPSEAFEGSAELTLAEDGQTGFKGTVAGPISDTVGYRLSGNYRNDDGYIENIATGNTINGTENYGLRGKLEFQASDALNILLTADYGEKKSNCCALMPILNENGPDPDGFVALIAPSVANEDSRTVNQTTDPRQDQDTWGISSEINYDFEWGGTLTAITSYRDWNYDGTAADIDFQPLAGATAVPGAGFTFTRLSPLFGLSNRHENQTISQEVRIASPVGDAIDWVAGLFYWNSEYSQHSTQRDAVCLGGGGAAAIGPCTTNSFFRSGSMFIDTENESMAVFGQVNWRPTEQLELFVGLRLIKEELEWSGFRPNAPVSGFPDDRIDTFRVPGGGSLPFLGSFETDDDNWAGKIGGKFDFSDNARLFVSYSRGYKGPAANTNGFNFGFDPVDPEIVDSYEIGLRSELLDNRVNLNITAFLSEFEDFQSQSIDQVSQAFNLSNVGVFETKGVEVELDAAVTDNLTLSIGLGYTDAVFEDFPDAQCYVGQTAAEGCVDGTQNLSGKNSPNSPDWKTNITARYEFPIKDWLGFVQGNYSWQDEIFFREDLNPLSFQDSYGLFDLSFGATSADDRYTVTLFVKNLFDKNFATNRFQIGLPPGNASGVITVSRNADRYVGGSLRINF